MQDPSFIQDRFFTVAHQITNALMKLHSLGIAHLDIKPGNIFVNKYNQIKLADFGFSVCMKGEKTISKRVGSRLFMAPEVVMGQTYDPFMADIYSLGVTLFVLLRSQNLRLKQADAFELQTEIVKECLKLGELGEIIAKCVALDPKARPTAAELEKSFSKFEQNECRKIHNESNPQSNGFHHCTLIRPKVGKRLSFSKSNRTANTTSLKIMAPVFPHAIKPVVFRSTNNL